MFFDHFIYTILSPLKRNGEIKDSHTSHFNEIRSILVIMQNVLESLLAQGRYFSGDVIISSCYLMIIPENILVQNVTITPGARQSRQVLERKIA